MQPSSDSDVTGPTRLGRPPLVSGEHLSLVSVANVILRRWRLLATIPFVVVVAAVLIVLLRPATYTARSRFLPQTNQPLQLGQVQSLAAQFGLPLGVGSSGGESPDFYVELVQSDDLLREAVRTEYRFPKRPNSADSLAGTLLELYDIQAGRPEERERRAIDRLREDISVGTGLRTNVVTLVTQARWPGLAVQLNQHLLELINRFNLERRQSRAAAERRFVEGRLDSARLELASAEGGLERFLAANRRLDSPDLQFQQARLQRQVDLRQQLYTSLATSYEQARIEEVRNTPVITLVDTPWEAWPVRRHLIRTGVIGAVMGGLLALFVTFAAEYLAREQERDPRTYGDFRRLLRSLLPPWRREAA